MIKMTNTTTDCYQSIGWSNKVTQTVKQLMKTIDINRHHKKLCSADCIRWHKSFRKNSDIGVMWFFVNRRSTISKDYNLVTWELLEKLVKLCGEQGINAQVRRANSKLDGLYAGDIFEVEVCHCTDWPEIREKQQAEKKPA